MQDISLDKKKAYALSKNGNGQYKINEYTLDKIKKHPEQYNVCIKKYNNDNEYIAWKPGQKPKDDSAMQIIRSIVRGSIHIIDKVYEYGSKSYCIQIILEDRSSAQKIIENIVDYFAQAHKIKLTARYFYAGGAGNIENIINYLINNSVNTIALYDYGVVSEKLSEVSRIGDLIHRFNMLNKHKIIGITPLQIEEFCLQYAGLMRDIVQINKADMQLLMTIDKTVKQGQVDQLYRYNFRTTQYSICNTVLPLNKPSKYFSKIKNIRQPEQYLQERLADITDGKPYEFIKRAEVCWYNQCKSSRNACRLDDIYGAVVQRSQLCRKSCMNKDKIDNIIYNSLFSVVFDALNFQTVNSGIVVSNTNNLNTLIKR